MKEKLIKINQIDKYEESDDRYFKVSYQEAGHVIKSVRSFKRKDHLNKFIADVSMDDVKIYICDKDK